MRVQTSRLEGYILLFIQASTDIPSDFFGRFYMFSTKKKCKNYKWGSTKFFDVTKGPLTL